MGYDRPWERLIDELTLLGSVVEVAPERTRLTFADAAGAPRSVEILMSRRQWEEMVIIPFADFATAAERVKAAILGLRDGERFLVYENYDLVPSTTPDLPLDPDPGPGRWVALDQDGQVVDEFRPGDA
jgi:hypothetical protein